MKKIWIFPLLCLFLFACSNQDADGNITNDQEPVTIRMQHRLLGEESFASLQKIVAEKYPYITVEGLDIGGHEREHYEEAVAAQEIPDILAIVTNIHDENIINVELDYDLTELIEKFDYDLSRFDESTLDAIRAASPEGLMGLPTVRGSGLPNFGVMMYNKEIFDSFGVDYPTEGMTWEETLELAKDLTIEQNGIQYFGLLTNNWDQIISFVTNSEPLLAADTHESLLDTDVWRRGLNLLKEIYSIPGYLGSDASKETVMSSLIGTFAAREAAMAFGFIPGNAIEWAEEGGLDWDLVPGPVFADGSEAPADASWTYTISAASEHKDDAFRVMMELLSDEMMILEGNRQGEPSRLPLTDENVMDQVELHPVMEDKNLDALFYHTYGDPVERSEYESYILREYFRDRVAEYIVSDEDMNTFIREANEEIDRLIEERLAGQ